MIRLEDLTIHQGNFSLETISLCLKKGSYATLMGPTGVGKTTLLEAICGIRPIHAGRIIVDEKDISSLPAAQRSIGYVPQDLCLFPTMRVDQQIGFGLMVRKQLAAKIKTRVDEVSELLGILHLLNRFPKGLSGGEKQRVAIARALAFRPRLLCLDEPLSALDDATRDQMVEQLNSIHKHNLTTVLHVTHNVADCNDLATQKFELNSNQVSEVR